MAFASLAVKFGLVAGILINISVARAGSLCDFVDTYPRQYVAYHISNEDIQLDGKLKDEVWDEVEFTGEFVDISTTIKPQFNTQAKILWSDDFLYVGAVLQEPNIWANITSTCHCMNSSQDQVIYHDNDFEIFIDPNGDTHFYKEYEMNALNATWDLILNKTYSDGGYENSSRVYGIAGFDMQPPLQSRVYVRGEVNNPHATNRYWSVEVALPLSKLVINETDTPLPPTNNSYWRINFSRVEWGVTVVGNQYYKTPSCQSCETPGAPVEDNWVWSPQGQVNMHAPETWGFLQFSGKNPYQSDIKDGKNQDLVYNLEWPARRVAMVLYYAQHAYYDTEGNFSDDLDALNEYAEPPILSSRNVEPVNSSLSPPVDSSNRDSGDLAECSYVPNITLTAGGLHFIATVTDIKREYTATIQDDRLLTVVKL